ncbi:MAG: M56 family metallopeptidase [Planctomycetota bacterium]|jgi:beta-lactamase regulating signal transducer with metallopeptidase domain
MNQAINTCITGLNNIGQGFWDYAAGIFIQVSVLIVLLLIIDFMLRKRVRAVFRYCLWMLVFIKLVMPASFTLPTGIGYWLGDYFPSEVSIAKFVPQIKEAVPVAINIPQEYIFLETPMMNETAAIGIELEAICWQGLVFLGWLVGMLVLLALLVKRVCFVRGLIAQSRPANERSLDILNESRSQIGIRQNIELRLSDNTLRPAVCGLFKPIILIPATLLKKLSREKLKAVLIHELAHIKRGDVWVNLLQTMLQIVYFYNPFVWLANAMVRRVREQAVDEMVLVTLKPEAKNYSNMLIDIAEMAFWRPNFSLHLIGVVESKKALERRIKHMLNRPVPKSSKLGYLGLIAIVVIGAILLPMGCNASEQTTLTRDDFSLDFAQKVTQFDIDNADLNKIIDTFGEPLDYVWGRETLDGNNLPSRYVVVYPNGFQILVSQGKVVEIRFEHEQPKDYLFLGKLGVGSSLDEVLEVIGRPQETIEGQEIGWVENVLYKDIDGRKGHCYYHRPDKNVRIFFGDYKVAALYITNSGYSAGGRGKAQEKADIPATSTINEHGHIVDKIDYPFVNDPEVIGGWKSVDFVREIDEFDPTEKNWKGDLFLNNLIFKEGGKISGNLLTWTKGLVLSDDTASKYIIREIDGSTYMFFEWKSGDYTIRHMRPHYYVLRKVLTESLKHEPMFGKKAYIPPTSTIDEDGRIVDKIDYPFINDSQVIGTWKSVDFVGEMKQFKVGEKQWKGRGGELFLKELIFLPNGRTFKPWWTWTKGLVFHSGDKTASKYTLKDIDGSAYMFYEWKSGDYTIRHRKPSYYVLKKMSSETGGLAEAWK